MSCGCRPVPLGTIVSGNAQIPYSRWFFPGFAEDQPFARWAPPSAWPDWTANRTGTTQALVGYLVTLYNVYLNPNCADNELFPFHCGSVTVMYPHIKSPLFVLQNMYDNNQIKSQLRMPACSGACSEQQLGFVRYFGRAQRNSTRLVIDSPRKTDGLFLPSCYDHTAGVNVGGTATIAGFGPTEMLG